MKNKTVSFDCTMICASAEAEAKVYRKTIGKSGAVWLVPIGPNPAENVHVHFPGKHSDGYAGRTLSFPLEDGTTYEAQGPWHSNSDSLFDDTGIDVRETYRTFVVLSRDVKYLPNMVYELVDVLYEDPPEGKDGRYNRDKDLAKQYPEARFCFMKSHGGGSAGPINKPYEKQNRR